MRTSSGTRPPESMKLLAFLPSSVPAFTCPCGDAVKGSGLGNKVLMEAPPPLPLVLSGHAASLTPY